MSKRRKWLLVGMFLGLVGVGTYFAWGARLEAEYERRVEALRDSGAYVDPPRSFHAQVPTADNAAVVLTEAAELLAQVHETDPELASLLADFTLIGPECDGNSFPDDMHVELRRLWPKLDSYFAKLDEAMERPTFAPPPLPGPGMELTESASWCGVQDIVDMLELKVREQPDSASDAITFLLQLADKWKPDGAMESGVRFTVRSKALGILQLGLRDGTLDVRARRQAWDARLVRVEPMAALKHILRFERMERIRSIEHLRRGEDELAELREEWRKNHEDWGIPDIPDMPWFASWYGRPVLHRHALENLDEAAFAIERATSEESLRETLTEEVSAGTELRISGLGQYVRTLEHLAVLRLARIAMAIQEDTKRRGGPRETLDGYAALFGGTLPRDPFTGKPFQYERHDDKVVLSCAVAAPAEGEWEPLRSALFKRLIFEELLSWEVRWEPANTGD